ncbi:MAG: FAD-dependent thymidylate synthase [Candidatus Micrarchaeia archaeon]
MESNFREARRFEKPKVKLISYTLRKDFDNFGPDEISAFGALGCFEEKTPTQIYDDMWLTKSREEIDKKVEKVLNASVGRGHGSVADQNAFIFEICNVSRATTLFLCSPSYLSHLQQSLRRANADRGYELPESILNSKMLEISIQVLDSAFKLYEEMIKDGIPMEDARYILPLYTRTNIQTLGDARELTHLHAMSKEENVPSVVKETVQKMIDEARKVAPKLFEERKMNYEKLGWYPAPQIYGENKTIQRIIEENKKPEKVTFVNSELQIEQIMKAIIDRDEAELANLKHSHNGSDINGFLTPMSLVTLHQAIRQRTWDHSVESIYDAVEREKIIIPKTIEDSKWKDKYNMAAMQMFSLYKDIVRYGIGKNDAIGVIPHALMIYDLIHINGWNALNAIGKRTCTEAQWEIREIAEGIALEIGKINPRLFAFLGPQCKLYGICPEKKPCYRFKKSFKESYFDEKNKEKE